jgi:ribosomal-protein-alanine N-acetyltransferase
VIRPAREDDVASLARLEAELFGAGAWSVDQVREEVAQGHLVVAEDEAGSPTAYVVTAPAGDVVDLRRIAVRPDHQGRGLGGILLTAALASGEPGQGRMMLEVSEGNAAAIALYHGHGFEVVDRRRRYYPDGSDALVMSRDLR